MLLTAAGMAGTLDSIGAGTVTQVDVEQKWAEWLDARAPAEHVGEWLEDSVGNEFLCMAYEHQPAFRRWEIKRAMLHALSYEEALASATGKSKWVLDGELEEEMPLRLKPEPNIIPIPEIPLEFEINAEEFPLPPSNVSLQPEFEDLRCSGEYVAIPRLTIDDIRAAGSLASFLKPKEPPHAPNHLPADTHPHAGGGGSRRLYATVKHSYYYGQTPGEHKGTRADVNMWNPYVENRPGNHFSLVQTWVQYGRDERIEIGWQKWENQSTHHLFVYTVSPTESCYEPCGELVILPGGPPIGVPSLVNSTLNGPQITSRIEVVNTGFWWVKLNNEPIGFYPPGTFDRLANFARTIDWGTEVTNPSSGRTTASDSGSGRFAEEGYGRAMFLAQMKRRPNNGTTGWYPYLYQVPSFGEEPGCTSVDLDSGYAFLGGPGYDAHDCP